MTKEEKFTSLAVYIAKLTDHLKGEENGDDTYYSRSRQVSEAFSKSKAYYLVKRNELPHIRIGRNVRVLEGE